jgi:hypothetical protein
VLITDLKASISLLYGSPRPECTLIWNALLCYKTTWREEDNSLSAELRIAVGKPLQLFFRRDLLYLGLFSENKNGM